MGVRPRPLRALGDMEPLDMGCQSRRNHTITCAGVRLHKHRASNAWPSPKAAASYRDEARRVTGTSAERASLGGLGTAGEAPVVWDDGRR